MVGRNKSTSFPRGLDPTKRPAACLRIHHQSNMPAPAVYVVVAVIGAVATGYAIKEVRPHLLLPLTGPYPPHRTSSSTNHISLQ
jgi:hypothetical protein